MELPQSLWGWHWYMTCFGQWRWGDIWNFQAHILRASAWLSIFSSLAVVIMETHVEIESLFEACPSFQKILCKQMFYHLPCDLQNHDMITEWLELGCNFQFPSSLFDSLIKDLNSNLVRLLYLLRNTKKCGNNRIFCWKWIAPYNINRPK